SAELLQRSPLGSNPGDIEDDPLIGSFVVRVEGGFDEILESIRPTLSRVSHFVRTITSQRAQIFLVSENSRVLQLLVIRMVLVHHDVHGHWMLGLAILGYLFRGIVSAYSTTLHEAQEREREVTTGLVSPARVPAIEEVLSSGHTASPKVPSGRKNTEVFNQLNEALTLPADVAVVRNKGEVSVHYTPNSFRPSLFSTVRLGTRVRALVDELPRRTPGNAIRFYQG